MSDTSIIIIDPERAMTAAHQRKDIVAQMIKDDILRSGIDYGSIPGTDKPTLFKPGAERLCSAFHLNPRFETLTAIERWEGDEPLFFYRIRCSLIHIETGLEVATGVGSCNSRETKYRWRWVKEMDVPERMDKSRLQTRSSTLSEFKFAIDEAKTTGDYGKPAAYWQRFKDAIADGSARTIKKKTKTGKEMDAYEIGGTLYRVPNDEIFDLVNTIDKMACKRALIAASLIGANASEFFTQDIEDMEGFGVQYGEDVIVSPTPAIVIESPRPSAPPPSDKIVTLPPEEPPHPVITTQEAKDTLGNGSNRRITEDAGNLGSKWATESSLTWMFNYCREKLDDTLTDRDIARYVDIETPLDFAAWNGKFSKSEDAMKAIKAGFEKSITPATTKFGGAPKWTSDELVILEKWLTDKFDMTSESALKAMKVSDWRTFANLFAAQQAIIDHALSHTWVFLANDATYDGDRIIYNAAVPFWEFSRTRAAEMLGAGFESLKEWQTSKTPYVLPRRVAIVSWEKHANKSTGAVYYTVVVAKPLPESAPVAASETPLSEIPF